jgi:hypothetical protein
MDLETFAKLTSHLRKFFQNINLATIIVVCLKAKKNFENVKHVKFLLILKQTKIQEGNIFH